MTARVNFKPDEQVWYRDSQLFESYQINEFTAELSKDYENSPNWLKFKGENHVEIRVKIVIPKKIPGFYTILSKMVDVLGQPVLEFNWNFQLTTGNRKKDDQIRNSVKHDEFERLGGGKIAMIWGRTIQNAARRKGLQNMDISFDQVNLGRLVWKKHLELEINNLYSGSFITERRARQTTRKDAT